MISKREEEEARLAEPCFEMGEGPLPSPEPAYRATLFCRDAQPRYVGVVEFSEHGVIFTGVPQPAGHEVVGLPDQTFFVPYANVSKVTFEASE